MFRAIISQSDVLQFVATNPECLSKETRGRSLRDLNFLATSQPRLPVCVKDVLPTIEAYELMETEGVSAVGVVDGTGRLVGNLSGSDLRGVRESQVAQLLLQVKDFLDLQQRQSHRVAHEEPLPCLAVRAGDTLADLVSKFRESRVHRLYVVDDNDGAPVTVITLTDMMRFLSTVDAVCPSYVC
eukprot:TRINITY_DN8875_c0_g1_i6.p1 TRINITY_DN8875_c0_g1~~TRINITY_DN8875_c0_g1_i6.p1  ORF type:complete len:184 (+),score=38.21 TRINITY_DN8875_c0_g1_i6:233-784(+)